MRLQAAGAGVKTATFASLQSEVSGSPSLSSSGSTQLGSASPSKLAKVSTSDPSQSESVESQDSGAPVKTATFASLQSEASRSPSLSSSGSTQSGWGSPSKLAT